MHLIKALIVDVVVTAVILVAVVTDLTWARWAVVIYTPFMLFLKVVALLGGSLTSQFKSKAPEAPNWAYHALYAVNVAALALAQWWIVAAQWLGIWIISFIQAQRSRRPSSA